jgi:mono/diheme cytochrome c family protein/nitrate reductase cytochrome c-type subunit
MRHNYKSIKRFGAILLLSGFLLMALQGCSGSGDGGNTDTGNNGGGAAGDTINPSNSPAYSSCLTDKVDFVDSLIDSIRASEGGQLYDEWWEALGYAEGPAEDHPIWSQQSDNTRTGADTWRCKECHGWDYKGMDGAYGTGSSHYTGFPGIVSASGKTAIEVFCTIYAGTADQPEHQFNKSTTNDMLTDIAVLRLTRFITKGLANTDDYIDPATGDVTGMATPEGQTVYETTAGCAASNCHTADGTLNAGDDAYLGLIANEDPWELLHKIRNGSPGAIMPAYAENPQLTLEEIQDVIAYIKTLPDGGGGGGGDVTPPPAPTTDADKLIMGGLLYDAWFEEKGVTPPAGDNPLWAYQSTNTATGADTWRCKECHGWDYKGKDGVYGSASSHYTGFIGLYNLALDNNKDEAYAIDFIKNGITDPGTGAQLHVFGDVLTDEEIAALAYFIKNGGIIDTDPYISTLKFAKGDKDKGKTQFTNLGFGVANGNCELCHGVDGHAINFGTDAAPEYVGDVARDNPWEALHKARFGQPGQNMPGMIQSDLSVDDSVDVITYAQSLP